jgi:ribosome biogenesis GTPase
MECKRGAYLSDQEEGFVIKAISGFYTISYATGEIVAQMAGRLKQEWHSSTLVAVGDRVSFVRNADGSGTVVAITPRKSVLSRTRPSAHSRTIASDQEQVLVANLDQVIFIFAAKQPKPNTRMLDRFLVVAERNRLPAIICINKVDLVAQEQVAAQFGPYEAIGYPVLFTSAKTNQGITELSALLQDKITVFTGPSGAGKSSLLNAIEPGLGLKVSLVSSATGKGRHTTRYAEMFPLQMGGFVADTPGIRGLALFDLEPAEIDAYFREIAPLVPSCRFSDCSHRHEPGCAVRAALATGTLSPARYDSYLRLREEHEALDDAAY